MSTGDTKHQAASERPRTSVTLRFGKGMAHEVRGKAAICAASVTIPLRDELYTGLLLDLTDRRSIFFSAASIGQVALIAEELETTGTVTKTTNLIDKLLACSPNDGRPTVGLFSEALQAEFFHRQAKLTTWYVLKVGPNLLGWRNFYVEVMVGAEKR